MKDLSILIDDDNTKRFLKLECDIEHLNKHFKRETSNILYDSTLPVGCAVYNILYAEPY